MHAKISCFTVYIVAMAAGLEHWWVLGLKRVANLDPGILYALPEPEPFTRGLCIHVINSDNPDILNMIS